MTDGKEKYIELAKKLQALVDQGVGGEKENAKNKLDLVMRKFGITIEDLGIESVKEYKVRVRENQREFFNQICHHVADKSWEWRDGSWMYVKCTEAEIVEIKMKFDFYWKDLEKQQSLLYLAFITKNNLFKKTSTATAEDATPEELERRRKAAQLARGIEKAEFQKRLG